MPSTTCRRWKSPLLHQDVNKSRVRLDLTSQQSQRVACVKFSIKNYQPPPFPESVYLPLSLNSSLFTPLTFTLTSYLLCSQQSIRAHITYRFLPYTTLDPLITLLLSSTLESSTFIKISLSQSSSDKTLRWPPLTFKWLVSPNFSIRSYSSRFGKWRCLNSPVVSWKLLCRPI